MQNILTLASNTNIPECILVYIIDVKVILIFFERVLGFVHVKLIFVSTESACDLFSKKVAHILLVRYKSCVLSSFYGYI